MGEDVESIYFFTVRVKWEIKQKSLEFIGLHEYLLVGLKTVSVKTFFFPVLVAGFLTEPVP